MPAPSGIIAANVDLRSVVTGTADLSQVTVAQDGNLQQPLELEFSAALNVDGSVTTQESEIPVDTSRNLYLTEVRMVIQSTGMRVDNDELQSFGAAGALTSGVRLVVDLAGVESEVFSANGVRTIADLFKHAAALTGITGGASSPNTDHLVARVSFAQPVLIAADSCDRVFIAVQDDLTSLDAFTATARGWWEPV